MNPSHIHYALVALLMLITPGCTAPPAEAPKAAQTEPAKPKLATKDAAREMPSRVAKTPTRKKTTMPYLLGTPNPYARALMKRVFKMAPDGAGSIEIVDMGEAGNQKVKTQPYTCREAADCGYESFKLIVTPKDNRVIGGLARFPAASSAGALAQNAGKLFRLMSGHKHLDQANAWLETQFKGGTPSSKTFGHGHLILSRTPSGDRWTVMVRLP